MREWLIFTKSQNLNETFEYLETSEVKYSGTNIDRNSWTFVGKSQEVSLILFFFNWATETQEEFYNEISIDIVPTEQSIAILHYSSLS